MTGRETRFARREALRAMVVVENAERVVPEVGWDDGVLLSFGSR